MTRFCMLLCALTLLSGCIGARPISGTIGGEKIWSGTVHIQGDVILEPGAQLLIEPGTEVVFLPATPEVDSLRTHPNFPGSELIVRGELIAEGLPDAPIVFRYVDADAVAGSWGGVNLEQSAWSSFSHCYFTQADSAVHGRQSRIFIEDSIFEGNLVAIRFHSSDILIEHNLIRRNGTGIRFHFGSPVIRFNRLEYNGKALFITAFPRAYHILDNDFVGSGEYQVVLGEEVPEDVLLSDNYWGSTDENSVLSSLFDGRIADYLGKAIVSPLRNEEVKGAGPSWKR